MSRSVTIELEGREPIEFEFSILPAERDVGIMRAYIDDFWPVVAPDVPFTKLENREIEKFFEELEFDE